MNEEMEMRLESKIQTLMDFIDSSPHHPDRPSQVDAIRSIAVDHPDQVGEIYHGRQIRERSSP